MRARRDRFRPTSLTVTRLEDRTVPTGGLDGLLTPPPYDPNGHSGLNTHPLSHFLGGTEFLSGPQQGDPLTLARQALQSNAAGLGLSNADVASAIVTNGYADADSGMYHAYFRQSHNGLEVFNTSVGVHVLADGRVLTVNGAFVPGLAATATGVVPAPAVSPTGAVSAAAAYFGITLATPPTLTSTTTSLDHRSVVSESEASVRPIDTRLVYVNTPVGVRAAWEFNLDVPGGDNWFNVAVDAATGQVTFWSDWVEHYSATYTALPLPTIDPTAGPRTTVVNPFDPIASPFGWQDTNGVSGAEFSDTRGNNVFAQADLFNTDNSSIRPDAGSSLVFNYPLNLSADPSGSVDAAVSQLFYLNNILHDVHHHYGFTEAAGNFQFRNYTGQGVGGDQVDADVLNGDSVGDPFNPNFATPPDGFNPRMEMFANGDFLIVPGSFSPRRDAAFSAQITVHEYGHGVSTRLTGGAANSNSLNNTQSGGMGEGWSDYWALMFTQQPTSTKNGSNPQGNWILGQPVNGPGVRRFPYSFDMTINPLTFDAYGTSGTTSYGVQRSVEVHDTGEIWASALWDMTWLLTDKYGFDKNLSTGYAAVNGPAGAGNKLSLKLVMDALKIQPANPTFLEARDAILAADLALTGGRNHREIWTAFARRGLGVNASTGNSNDTSVSADFSVPGAMSNPAVIAQTPAAKVVGGAAPGSVTFTFSEPMNQTSFSVAADVQTFTGPNAVDLKPAITGFAWVTPTQLRIDFTPLTGGAAQGAYQLVLGPDVRSADNGSQLDQNIDGATGGAADTYTANFQYDALALRAVLTSTPSASNPALTGSVLAAFNEEVSPASISIADLQVSQGTVTAATIVSQPGSPTIVRYDLAGVATAPLYVSLLYGAVADLYGFPNEEANAKFGKLVIPAVPFPTPLVSYGPLGWGSFSGSVSGPTVSISTFGEVDSYSLSLDAGQILSVTADRLASSLRAQLQLFDPDGNPIALATSANAGDTVTVGPVVSPTPGRYVMQISGTSNSTGSYRLRVLVSTSVEIETQNPNSTNDSPFSAEDLNAVLLPQGGPGTTLRGVTVAGNIGKDDGGGGFPFSFGDTDDYYTFDAAANQQFTVGLGRPGGGSIPTLTVTGPSGATIPLTVPNPTNFDRAVTFTPTLAGTYTVRVSVPLFGTTTTGTDYTLGVILNGAMDLENNSTAATAKPAALSGNLRGGLTAGDEDWYQVTVPVGPAVTLYLTSFTPADGPDQPDNFLDPHVEVYSSAGTILVAGGTGTDNAAADQKNSVVVANLTAGTYQIRVLPSPLTVSPTTGEYIVQLSTAANPGPVGPSAGGAYTVTEGGTLVLNGSATDPNGDSLNYSWDLNGDGVFGDGGIISSNASVPWATLLALGITDGPATFAVQLRVDDGTSPPVLSVPTSLTLLNGPPLATLYIGATGTATTQSVTEGSASVVVRLADPANSAATPTDPAPLDALIGLRYSFDLNGDGLFNAADAALGGGDGSYAGSLTNPTATVPASVFLDGIVGGTTVTIQAIAIDKDSGVSTPTSVTFTVTNVAPSATGVTGSLSEGVNGTVTVVGPTDASPIDRAVPATATAGLHYSFELDLDNNGSFETVIGGTTYATALTTTTATVPGNLLPDGPATVQVRATVYDKDGGVFTTGVATLTVGNSAPVGTISNNGPVNEGSTGVVQVSGVTDVSGPDTTAGFRFAVDFDGDGIFEIGGDVNGAPSYATGDAANTPTALPGYTVTVPAQYLADGNAVGAASPTVRPVTVRVYDKNGGFTSYTTDVRILNVAPTATLSGSSVTIGSPLSVSLINPSDPSVADTTAGFTYSFDFNNDGDFLDTGDVLNSSSASAAFIYPTPGSQTVHARITDKDGGATDVSQTFVVNNVPPTATLAFPSMVVEGATATIAVNAQHPSAATTAAGFRYAFDFDGDGVFDAPAGATSYANAGTAATVDVPATMTADGPKQLAVRVRVFEVNGASADFIAPIEVQSVAPTSTFAGPTAAVEVSDKVTFTFSNTTDPSPTDRNAGFLYSIDLNNDNDFTDDGEFFNSATASVSTQFTTTGNKTVHGRVTDKDGAATDYYLPVTVRGKVKTGYAAGVDAGNAPVVQLYNPDGTVKFQIQAFDPSVTGGVRVAVADVNGDGVADLIAGTGPGTQAEIRVFDGTNAKLLFSARPFEGFTGGVFVAAGDVDGDGKAEFAVSPDQGGGPRVVLYRGAGFLQTISFLGIDDAAFRGGARISMSDVTGDGRADLVVSAGFLGGPRVAGYEGSGLLVGAVKKAFNDFFAFEPGLRNGVYLAGGDVNGDGVGDLVIGAGPGGSPRVSIFDGAALIAGKVNTVASFFTGNDSSRGGVRVAVADVDADGLVDVIAGEADGPRMNLYYGKNLKTGLPGDDVEFLPFSTLTNGVFVG